jgi:iron complex transport system permease protein
MRTVAAAGLLVLVMFACSLIGPQALSWKAVAGGPTNVAGPNPDYEIFVHVRIPRIVLAALVGAALSSAGVVFQALLRNPLADPYILGVSSGAGLGTMLAVIGGFGWTLWGRSPIAVFAFVGALATVWLVWGLGRITGRYHVTGLLLAGVVVNAFFSALIMFLMSIAKGEQLHATMFWLMGNMTEEDFFALWVGAGCILTGIVALFFLSPQLNIISVGYHDAQSIGVPVRRIEFAAFAISAFITAVAVSLSGLIGFVGLIIPHAIRLVRSRLSPVAAAEQFARPFSVAAALWPGDRGTRTIAGGVITAMVGAVFPDPAGSAQQKSELAGM